ncbi:hypothetical protein [Arcticibacter eurypsychrophilus]|uniref:hypothetical protein n=1 Tax=Arcticibacter eurypsychrophilus TaxID=1434752 RepID=UPI00084D688E|nr:hypothetical protein [Arcticibacter eurypsychrophilus]
MKYIKIITTLFFMGTVFSCGVETQVSQLEALQSCIFKVKTVDSIYLANTPIEKLYNKNGLDLSRAPSLAFSMLQQKLPIKARINLGVTNPGSEDAGINAFEYIIMIADQELMKGFYNQAIMVPGNGGEVTIPFKIDTDIYPIMSKPENQKLIADFFSASKDTSVLITVKIKPNIIVADKKVEYPGYIDIKKVLSNKELLPYLK